MRIAVDLVIRFATAADAEAVQRGLNARSESSQYTTYLGWIKNPRDNAQLNKACVPAAEGTMSPVRKADVKLSTGIIRIQLKLCRVDTASDLKRMR